MGMIEYAKELGELIKKYNDQELYERIVKLREYLLELREENVALKEKIGEMERANDISKRIKRDFNCYFLEEDVEKQNPYCLTCWDADRKLISLIQGHSPTKGPTVTCNICIARGKDQ